MQSGDFAYNSRLKNGVPDDNVGPQATLFSITRYVGLIASAQSGEDCHAKGYLFQKSVLAVFGVFGVGVLAAGLWFLFFGIDRPYWRGGLGFALCASGSLIVGSWFTQAIYPLPVAFYAEYASVFCGSYGVSAARYSRAEIYPGSANC
jgi:hypothetical protein